MEKLRASSEFEHHRVEFLLHFLELACHLFKTFEDKRLLLPFDSLERLFEKLIEGWWLPWHAICWNHAGTNIVRYVARLQRISTNRACHCYRNMQ